MSKTPLIPSYCLTMTPNGVHIEGHRGIEQYGRELIAVRTKNKIITLRGTRLSLGAMNSSEILITGVVMDVELTERGERR